MITNLNTAEGNADCIVYNFTTFAVTILLLNFTITIHSFILFYAFVYKQQQHEQTMNNVFSVNTFLLVLFSTNVIDHCLFVVHYA